MNILTYFLLTYSFLTDKLNKYMINNIQEYLLPLSNKHYNTELSMKISPIYICLNWNSYHNTIYYNKIIYIYNKYWTMVNRESKTDFKSLLFLKI